jgi:hypothetical protein
VRFSFRPGKVKIIPFNPVDDSGQRNFLSVYTLELIFDVAVVVGFEDRSLLSIRLLSMLNSFMIFSSIFGLIFLVLFFLFCRQWKTLPGLDGIS